MYKVDLHTHSSDSPDGGIKKAQYRQAIKERLLDCIAITDHNSIDFALEMQAELPDRIIVGEEIMTTLGEIIGLFLSEAVPSNLSPEDAIKRVKQQGGLVYIPHPLENIRHGLPIFVLDELIDEIDIVEVGNGRALFQHRYTQILVWSNLNHLATAASSDAHGYRGLGSTYSSVTELPTTENLKALLFKGHPVISRPTLRGLLYPTYNRIKKRY